MTHHRCHHYPQPEVAKARFKDLLHSQGLANAVWAFSTARRTPPVFFDANAEVNYARLKDLHPQVLAKTA
eukprot:11660032-Karenia_brevis.AAC.1